jgi:hypothetical protein
MQYATTLAALGPLDTPSVLAMRGEAANWVPNAALTRYPVADPANWPVYASWFYMSQYDGTNHLNLTSMRQTLLDAVYIKEAVYDYTPLEWGTLPSDLKNYRVIAE